jgi:transglutaminase-like putative cysteine protease
VSSLYRRYLLVSTLATLVGLLAFAVATNNVFIAVVSLPACIVAQAMFRSNLVSPLPRWFLNVLLGIAALSIVRLVDVEAEQTVTVIGEYLVWLQLIKLFEDRTPRNQGQQLVLSALLIVAAVLTSVTLDIALALLVYGPLALSWAVLFQMYSGSYREWSSRRGLSWRSTDTHRDPPDYSVTPAQMQQSRRLVLAGATTAFALGIVVFLLMPRNLGRGIVGDFPRAGTFATTGFTDQIQLGVGSGNITESTQTVMTVRVERRDSAQPARWQEVLSGDFRLRGVVLDRYSPKQQTWMRSTAGDRDDQWKENQPRNRLVHDTLYSGVSLASGGVPELAQGLGTVYRLRIGTIGEAPDNLFALWMPADVRVSAGRSARAWWSPIDGLIRLTDRGGRRVRAVSVEYEVLSVLNPTQGLRTRDASGELRLTSGYVDWLASTARRDNPFLPGSEDWESRAPIRELALRIADERDLSVEPDPDWYAPYLSEADFLGLPPELRGEGAPPADARSLVRAFERYLSNNFTYTLELERAPGETDSIVYFLETRRRGHCEYFASALAAMCRSVNINARVVLGYVATEFEPAAGEFIVREKHAHAWVEAETEPGVWETFDPSPRADLAELHRPKPGLLASARRFFDTLEATWIRSVIAFDQSSQARFFGMREDGQYEVPGWARNLFGPRDEGESRLLHAVRTAVSAVVVFLVFFVSLMAGHITLGKVRDRRRRERGAGGPERPDLGDALPEYNRMVELLRGTRFAKPDTLPPVAHADAIEGDAPTLAARVRTLAGLYYAARFGRGGAAGGGGVADEQRGAARAVLADIERDLASLDEAERR